MSENNIEIYGARVHNLKNIDVMIPRESLTVITGLSGSGKSSLAFDTIYAEGQRRYIETFSAYARNFLGGMERPDVDKITGLSPVISIEQKTTNKNPRSTVGTQTEIYDFLRLLYARAGEAYSWRTGERMVKYTEEKIISMILSRYSGRRIFILAPLIRNPGRLPLLSYPQETRPNPQNAFPFWESPYLCIFAVALHCLPGPLPGRWGRGG